ncbi:MAG: hypothetical protein ABEJ25_03995 [Candidatus Bipolaricaulia bacterium]
MYLTRDHLLGLWRLLKPLKFLSYQNHSVRRTINWAVNDGEVAVMLDQEELEALVDYLPEDENQSLETPTSPLQRVKTRCTEAKEAAKQDWFEQKVPYKFEKELREWDAWRDEQVKAKEEKS